MGDQTATGEPRAGHPTLRHDDRAGDAAAAALDVLVAELKRCTDALQAASCRAAELQDQRRGGRTWQDIVANETRPLVVELISEVMASLATAGGRWRREEALALHAEGVSINRIAAQFGVTRQRISALIKSGNGADTGLQPHAKLPGDSGDHPDG
jgi:hypothetical protein